MAAQQQRELAARQQREIAEQRQRELAAQQQREIAEQRQRELAAQQQREIAEQRQRELAAQQQREIAEQQQRELAEQQQPENTANTNNQQTPPQPSNVAGGSLIASLVGEPQQGNIDRLTHPATIKPSNQPFSKGLEYVKYIEKKSGEPIELTVELTISETGKLENVLVADNAIPAREKSYYQEQIMPSQQEKKATIKSF